MQSKIQTHDINKNYDIIVTHISHNNKYDYTRIHRHDYFEILFFETGGGYQLIDFDKITILDNSCYIIKPKQIHLVKRNKKANGLLIQFKSKTIFSDSFLDSLNLMSRFISSPIIFEKQEKSTIIFNEKLLEIKNNIDKKSTFYKQKNEHLLSNILYSLEEILQEKKIFQGKKNILHIKFIELVEQNINSISISEYAERLSVSQKKLTFEVKQFMGVTPLAYIHNILLLNIKRDLAFKEITLKEIAYSYNFQTPSHFTNFIKKMTGMPPVNLQKEIREKIN